MTATSPRISAFCYETPAQRVVFRTGGSAVVLAEEVVSRGARRVLLVVGAEERSLAESLIHALPVVAVFDQVRPHVPVEVADAARRSATESGADLVVAFGGGSTTGTAKAIALTSGLPIIAVPTTYAGSEATTVWGLTGAHRKSTGVDPVVLPRVIVYDATLQLSLPSDLSVASGLNALAHCIDSVWAVRANPISTALAMEGAGALRRGLLGVHNRADDIAAREHCLYGAYLAATAFSTAGSGLHHKICHVLGGAYDLPHAQTHAVVLPHVAALNVPAVPDAEARIGSALRAPGAVHGLVSLANELSAPRALRDLGMREEDLDEATDLVLEAAPPSNPAPLNRDRLKALLRSAWAGDLPAATSCTHTIDKERV